MPDDTQTGGQAPAGEQGQAPNAANDPNTQNAQQSNQQSQNAQNAQNGQQQPQEGSNQGQGQDQGQGQQNANTNTNGADSDLTKRLERMEKELADTRKEAANYRTKAKELDKLREEAETANLDDTQKAQKRAEDAEKRLAATRLRVGSSELKLAAQAAGIIDPDDAIAHLAARLDYDDEGEPKNVTELVAGLKASKPHLFAKADEAAQVGKGNAAASGGSAGNANISNAGGATNPPRTGAPLAITANQYLDAGFQKSFRAQHGMDILTAVRQGKATLI